MVDALLGRGDITERSQAKETPSGAFPVTQHPQTASIANPCTKSFDVSPKCRWWIPKNVL